MQKLEEFYNKKTALLEIVNQEKKILKKYDLSILVEHLESIEKKIGNIKFNIVVMGNYSSGKTALINTLLGEKVFPESALPSTAFEVKICYGTDKKLVLYPTDDSKPLEIALKDTETNKYLKINNITNIKENERILSKYKMAIAYLPVEFLKYGVSILDTIGASAICNIAQKVVNYCLCSDLIVYCMPAMCPCTKFDESILSFFNMMGIVAPIIATTYCDVATEKMSSSEKNEFMDKTYDEFYSAYTLQEKCFFLNSKKGQIAKSTKETQALIDSGYGDFEKYIDTIFADNGLCSLKAISDELLEFSTKLNELFDRILSNDQENRNVYGETLQNKILIQDELKRSIFKLRDELNKTLAELFPILKECIIYDEFKTSVEFEYGHPTDKVNMFIDEYIKFIQLRIAFPINDWLKSRIIYFSNISDAKLLSPKDISALLANIIDVFTYNIASDFETYTFENLLTVYFAPPDWERIFKKNAIKAYEKQFSKKAELLNSLQIHVNEFCDSIIENINVMIENDSHLYDFFLEIDNTEKNNDYNQRINRYKNILLYIKKTQDKLKSDFTH